MNIDKFRVDVHISCRRLTTERLLSGSFILKTQRRQWDKIGNPLLLESPTEDMQQCVFTFLDDNVLLLQW